MKQGRISIELRSDLCAGSGYSYAGIIDSDICYDDCGFPYIPARRLKGCMREMFETLLYKKYDGKCEQFFGKAGSYYGTENGSFSIENAYLDDYENLRNELLSMRFNENLSQYCTPADIIGCFSRIVGQTAMKDGVADSTTLRYTRVVNKYSPFVESEKDCHGDVDNVGKVENVSSKNGVQTNLKPLKFFANVLFDDNDQNMLEDIVKAVRHIGLKRNRGMGNVRCELEVEDEDLKIIAESKKEDNGKCSGYVKERELRDGRVELFYAIQNIQPLMISAENEAESESYISGQQVLGMMASHYLEYSNHNAENVEFRELFLGGGETIFSNLYPYDGERIYYPAPGYIKKLKKSKKYVFTLEKSLPEVQSITDGDYRYDGGNLPKKLKGKYVAVENKEDKEDGKTIVRVYDVKKDIFFHHSHINTHKVEKGREEGITYTGKVIRAGQMFAGVIIVKDGYKETIKNILQQGYIGFGKSKSAQYGKCRLIDINKSGNDKTQKSTVEARGSEESKVTIKKGEYLLVTFLSDVAFLDKEGRYVTNRDAVSDILKELLEVDGKLEKEDSSSALEEGASSGGGGEQEKQGFLSEIQTGLVTGFSGIWGLRKMPVPVIRAGSCFVFKLKKAYEGDVEQWIGERTIDGLGHVKLDNAEKYKYVNYPDCEEVTDLIHIPKNTDDITDDRKGMPKKVKPLLGSIILKRWMDKKINEILDGGKLSGISNSAAGRFKLMLMESIEARKDSEEKAFKSFVERIESIKSDSTLKAGKELLSLVGKKNETNSREENSSWIFKENEDFFFMDKDTENSLKGVGYDDDEITNEKKRRWSEYVMAIIVDRKLNGREG